MSRVQLDYRPYLRGENTIENIQIAFYQHRRLFRVIRKANRRSRWLIYGFMALTVFNLVYFLLPTEPAAAFLPDLFTPGAVGSSIGNNIIQFAFGQVERIYRGEFGILPLISQIVLFFATPVVAAGVVVSLGDQDGSDLFRKPWVLGSFLLILGLSGGGRGIGDAYIFIFRLLEGIAGRLDQLLAMSENIASAKGYLTVNAAVAGSVAECQSFTGQEQKRCIFEASQAAITIIQNSARIATNTPGWSSVWQSRMAEVALDILNPNTSLSAKASNAFFLLAAPQFETVMAYVSNIVITVVSMFYAMTMAFMGLGLPIMGLSSILVPAWRSGWVAWLVAVLGLWSGRVMYLLIVWLLSRLLVESAAADINSTGWFSVFTSFLAPFMAFKLAKGGASAVYSGLVNAASNAVGPAIGPWVQKASIGGGQVAGAVAGSVLGPAGFKAGTAVGGTVGQIFGGAIQSGSFGADATDVSSPPRVNIS